MQTTLRDANLSQPNAPGANNPFSGGVWSGGKSWLLAAASISTVALIAFSIWQQREINQLRQTIGQLHPQSTNQPAAGSSNLASEEQVRPDVAHSGQATPSRSGQESTTSANRNESQAVRPDTVYITRYVPVPSRAKPDVRNEERFSQRVETPTDQRYSTEKPVFPPTTTRESTNLSANQERESNDASSTPSVAKNTRNESTIADKPTNTSIDLPATSVKDKGLISQNTERKRPKRTDTSLSGSAENQLDRGVNNAVATDNKAIPTESAAVANEASNTTSAKYEQVASLPLAMESKNWNAALAQRAKRMQPARAMPVMESIKETKAPAIQRIERVATRFRAGIGGEVASRLWSAGVFTEVLLGRHWTASVGLSEATYQNRFITEDDFNGRTQRDFRKEFARPGDFWRDILNIDTRQVRLQIPVSLGYRIPLNQALTLIPSVGTYLNLNSSENLTYYCRDIQRFPLQPQRGFDEINTVKKQPVDLLNSLSLGTGLEWQGGHWVVQTTPILTIPTDLTVNKTDLNWQKNTTVGLRARLLYQF